MSKQKKLIIVGNYPSDKQASMALFADWIATGLTELGWTVEIIKPPVRLAQNARSTLSGFGKWLGYVDKFILFPKQLKQLSKKETEAAFLIADHSNAYYARFLPRKRTAVTCHDVLAIEGALGDPEAFCPASRTGVLFQKWILSHIKQAGVLCFVSKHTQKSYNHLPGQASEDQQQSVIPNGINQPLEKLHSAVIKTRLKSLNPILNERPYLLHVGSSLPRKNRIAVMHAYKQWADVTELNAPILLFIGKPLSTSEHSAAAQLQLNDRLLVYSGVLSPVLEAAYNGAFAFCFPSFSEGFGWPIIEAQSCGAPVIAGNRSCLPEIAGKDALLCDPYKPETMLPHLKALESDAHRQAAIKAGFDNIQRFSSEATLGNYAKLFDSLTAG